MNKHSIIFVATLLLTLGNAKAQPFTQWGPSDPSRTLNCGVYQWPEVWSPCPEVQVKQKHDHTPIERYRHEGWDTVVTNCEGKREIVLTCTPYIPVQYFNGQYTVDEIPYNPADTTYYINYDPVADANNPNKIRLDINCDDIFAAEPTQLGFPFFFFGKQKTQFRLGDNGMVTFTNRPMPNDAYRGNCYCNNSRPYCPYSFGTRQLPWDSAGTPELQNNMCNSIGTTYMHARMHDAIFGIYEDTYPQVSTVSWPQGIYYGVIGAPPCRKIIASWNDIPQYNSTQHRDTYQMVCYEGSNIIEIHIKRHDNYQEGIIGILNETGLGQIRDVTMINGQPNPLAFVEQNAHAAYYPQGKNNFTAAINYTSYRFTPQGQTPKNYFWYILREDGSHDTLGTTDDGMNSYYDEMQGFDYPDFDDAPCPTLTKCYVRINEPTKFVFHLRFLNALGTIYDLEDTVFVGADLGHDINLHAQGAPSTKRSVDICATQTANLEVEWPRVQDTVHTSWAITRILNGDTIELPRNLITITRGTVGDSLVTMPVRLNSNGLPPIGVANKIDSIYLQISADFVNCTDSNSRFLVRVFPNFDTTVVQGICEGGRYYWTADSSYHYTATDPAVDTVLLKSVPQCDSLVRLALTVYGVTHTTDTVFACEPYTWINGQTYYEDNASTALQDTILEMNQWGCDSIVHLDFHMMPLTAMIRTNIDHFTLNNLDVVLNDISVNSNSRTWLFPDGGMQTAATAYYTLPIEYDSALIQLVAYSAYGDCEDTAVVVIPLQRENIWLPNAFMPDNLAGNNLFGSISKNTLSEEMLIYNRHGELVYKCEQIDCTWDGKDLNGNTCPQGTYVYIIRYTTSWEPDREHLLRGTVTLIR